jgi:hypothetical protein
MIFNIGFLANPTAGQRLKRNITLNAVKSHPAISKMVKLVTAGWGVRIISVIITPREIPTAKLENRTIKLCTVRIVTTVLGFAPIARKTANS